MSATSPSGKGSAGTIFLTTFLDMLGVTLIIPIVAPLLIKSDLIFAAGVPETTRNYALGILMALFPIGTFFASPFLGSLSDKLGRKPVLFWSLFVTFSSYGLSALAIYLHSLWLLLIARALLGLAAGNMAVVFSAMADISTPETKTKNFGLVGMAFGIGFVIGPMLGGILSDPEIVSWFSLGTPFLFAALLSLLNIFMVLTRFPETLIHKREVTVSALTGFKNLSKAFGNPVLRNAFLVVFFFVFGFSFFTQFFQVFMMKKFNTGQKEIGMIFGYIGVLVAFTQGGLVRVIGKHFVPRAILLWMLPISALGYWGLLLPQSVAMIYVVLLITPVAQGLISPNMVARVSNAAPANMQGEVMGIQSSVQSLAQFIPAALGGYLLNYSSELPMLVAGLSATMAFFILLLDKKSK